MVLLAAMVDSLLRQSFDDLIHIYTLGIFLEHIPHDFRLILM